MVEYEVEWINSKYFDSEKKVRQRKWMNETVIGQIEYKQWVENKTVTSQNYYTLNHQWM